MNVKSLPIFFYKNGGVFCDIKILGIDRKNQKK
jgi:hypothetical protein